MTEKTNKIKLPKYSSYLTDNDSVLLDSFCTQFDCSKAKALPLLLKFWSDNKNNVSNELATISSEDISAKKYDERLATIEDKLAKVNYDTELATIKERLATLENMLATIANEDLATISNELAIEDKEDITADSTLSECDILSLNEELPHNVPDTENVAVNGEIVENDTNESSIEVVSEDNSDNEIKPFEKAKLEVLRLCESGMTETNIARALTGKFYTAKGKTNWGYAQVKRIIEGV